jgi:hypothetical protein
MTASTWEDWLSHAERLLFEQKRLEDATHAAEQALKLKPDCAAAHQVVGLALSELGEAEEAIVRLNKALVLQPDLVRSHSGLGLCHYHKGDLESARRHLDRALCLQADYPFAHLIRALVWLKQGRFREGWVEYEWRWNCGLLQRPQMPRPHWDGSALEGRSILIDTEQGLGDVLQFIRFLPLLKRQGARIVLVVTQNVLHPLLRQLPSVDEWFPVGESRPISFDVSCPLLSVPGLLGIDEAGIPRTVPYLAVEQERVERWRSIVGELPGFKVGIAWQGNPEFRADRFRSIALSRFAALAEVPGVTLVSLQKGPGEDQIEPNRDRLPLHVFADLDRDGAFLDTAAVIGHLDLVIAADTAVGHLAGALGRPVWVLLSTGCDWRWLENRADSPWYPTMRLFRQKVPGDWMAVFQEVAAELKLLARGRQARQRKEDDLIRAPVSAGELLDKITILLIKQERIGDEAKLANVRRELELLGAVRQKSIPESAELTKLVAELKRINEKLWDIEDDIRKCESASEFGKKFVNLARAVYRNNDERSALKRRINELLGSAIVEEKSYPELKGAGKYLRG